MPRQALQIYLTAEQHLALYAEAQRSGRSMTQVVRDLIDCHVRAGTSPTDLSALVGAVKLGRPTNIGGDKDRMVEDAIGDLHRH